MTATLRRQVPLLDLRKLHAPIQHELEEAIGSVLTSQQYILGDAVKAFEQEMARYLGVPHALGCANGTDALFLALMAAGIGPGDKVLTTPFSFFATAGAITRAGATPVFADIDPGTFNLCPDRVRETLERHESIKAMIPVHLFGGAADMDRLQELACAAGLTMIEDAAQAIGATYRGRMTMTLGDAACLSFFPTKNLGALGDAGMVTSIHADIAERVSALRLHGSKVQYRHELAGINSRLDTLQAAALRIKLRCLDEWNRKRAENARVYDELLRGAPVTCPPVAGYQTRHIFHHYVIRAPRRDELKSWLAEQGIAAAIYYPIPLHLQPCYENLGYRAGDLPESERAAGEVLAIPVHPTLEREDLEYVAAAIRRFYEVSS